MRVHRLVIDSWPTPDGQPFSAQDEDMWAEAVEHWAGNFDAAWPSWLPESLDITEWLPTDGSYGHQEWPAKTGSPIGEYDDLVMNVPRVPRRMHYFSKSAAQKVLAVLAEWGVIGHIESSEPIVWRVTSDGYPESLKRVDGTHMSEQGGTP